jgi:DNA-binding PadR family transcriptional regulator
VTDPKLLILASLADGDKHGYAIIQDVQRFAGVRLGAGTLYGAITRLEALGWICGLESEDRRKPYRITADGRRCLEEQMDALDRVVRAARRRLRPA